MNPAIAAAGISAVGNVVGGLLGKKKSKPWKTAYKTTMALARAADELGIHRLSLLSGAPGGYSGIDGDSVLGDSVRYASDAVARGIEANEAAKRDAADREANQEVEALNRALVTAEIAEARSRTLLNEANAKRLLEGPRPQTNGTHGGAEMLLGRQVSQDPARDMPALQIGDLGGMKAYGPNVDLFEIGLSELIAGGLIYGPQWLYGAATTKLSPEEYRRQEKRRQEEGLGAP